MSLTAPPSGTVSGAVTLSATATDNVGVAGVQFLVNGAPFGAEDTTAPYSTVGGHHPRRQRHLHGGRASPRRRRQHHHLAPVTVTVDNTAPTVSLTAPANAAADRLGPRDADRHRLRQCRGGRGAVPGERRSVRRRGHHAPYSVTWTPPRLANGTYKLTARARDAAGNTTTSAPVTVTVANGADTGAPTVSPPSRRLSRRTVSGDVTLTATASDNVGVAGVQFLVNGAPFCTEDTTRPTACRWTPPRSPTAPTRWPREPATPPATPPPRRRSTSPSPTSHTTTLVSGLSAPIDFRFLPDGRILIAQKGGTIRVANADGQLQSTPLITLPTNSSGTRGLLGIAVDPDYANPQNPGNNYVLRYVPCHRTPRATLTNSYRGLRLLKTRRLGSSPQTPPLS